VLNLEVVIIHPPDGKAKLRGPGLPVVFRLQQLALARGVPLIGDDRLKALAGRLDRSLVYVARYPTTAELLRDSCRRAGTDETVKDNAPRIRAC
jgi:hypothetical protein